MNLQIMSASLLIEQFRLRCSVASLLISAAELEVKEYEAGWRDGGVKILRQGGRFASATAKDVGNVAQTAKEAIAKEVENATKSRDALSRKVLKALDKAFGKIFEKLTATTSVQSSEFTAEQLEQPEFQRAITVINEVNMRFYEQYKREIHPQLADSKPDPTKTLEDLMAKSLKDTKDLDKSFLEYVQEASEGSGEVIAQATINAAEVLTGGTIGLVALGVAFPPAIPVLASVALPSFISSVAVSLWGVPVAVVASDSLNRFNKITGSDDQEVGGKAIEDLVADVAASTMTGVAASSIESPRNAAATVENAEWVETKESILKDLGLDRQPNTIAELRTAYTTVSQKHYPGDILYEDENRKEVERAFVKLESLMKKSGK